MTEETSIVPYDEEKVERRIWDLLIMNGPHTSGEIVGMVLDRDIVPVASIVRLTDILYHSRHFYADDTERWHLGNTGGP